MAVRVLRAALSLPAAPLGPTADVSGVVSEAVEELPEEDDESLGAVAGGGAGVGASTGGGGAATGGLGGTGCGGGGVEGAAGGGGGREVVTVLPGAVGSVIVVV